MADEQRDVEPSKRSRRLPSVFVRGALLFVLATVVYVPAMRSGFIWDDDTFLTENPLIHASDGLWRFWFSTDPPDYFPLTSSMLWLEWRLWGGSATGFHVVSVLLHATSAVLLWRVLLRFGLSAAWLGAAIFALHPVAVESVAWITERKNTLPMVFYLGALLAYLRSEDGICPRRSYGLALFLFLLALLGKSSAVVLAPILLLIAWWQRGRIGARDLRRTAPFFTLALVLGLVTVWYQSSNAIGDELVRTDGLASRTALAGRAVWFYLAKALVPVDLSFVYPRWETGAVSARSFLPLLALAATLILLASLRSRWSRVLLFALMHHVLALLPVLGWFDIYFMRYSLVADHWQYTALLGTAGLIAAAWSELARRLPSRAAALGCAALVLLVLSSATWRRQAIYHDETSLWEATVKTNPGAWIAWSNLGLARHAEGRLEEALLLFERALECDPSLAEVHYNRGSTLRGLGRFDESASAFAEVLRLHPASAPANNALGLTELARGRRDAAAACFERALELDPELAEAHTNLGNAHLAAGRAELAVARYERALTLEPDQPQVASNLGSALQALGELERAVEWHRAAVRLAPDQAGPVFNLANALREHGRTEQAVAAYRQALELQPDLAGAHYHVAELLLRSGDARLALEHHAALLELEGPRDHVLRALERAASVCTDRELAASYRQLLESARVRPSRQ